MYPVLSLYAFCYGTSAMILCDRQRKVISLSPSSQEPVWSSLLQSAPDMSPKTPFFSHVSSMKFKSTPALFLVIPALFLSSCLSVTLRSKLHIQLVTCISRMEFCSETWYTFRFFAERWPDKPELQAFDLRGALWGSCKHSVYENEIGKMILETFTEQDCNNGTRKWYLFVFFIDVIWLAPRW